MAQQMDPGMQNLYQRNSLIATGLQMVKKLPTVTKSAVGGSMRIPLDRLGITTGILLKVVVPLTISAEATASPFGPYNFINNITYTDFSGLNRINTSGYQLHTLNAFRANNLMNNAFNGVFLTKSEIGLDTNILYYPHDASGTGKDLTFFLYVPFAIDPQSDLRGAVLAQTISGDHYLTLQLPNTLGGDDPLVYPFAVNANVALASGKAISVTAYQHYIMPQGGVNNLPMIDLSTIYAIEGGTVDSSNITAGQSKYINWPNNRAILSALHIFQNGGALQPANGTDISEIVLLGNGNTRIREMGTDYLRAQMRYQLQSDLASGVYYIPSRRQPITTQLYGNVQTQLDIVTANAGCYISSQYESTYLSGTPLPGIVQ